MPVPGCSSSRRTWRRRTLAASCIAAALALSGCEAGQPDPGAASTTATATANHTAGYGCLPEPPGASAPCYYTPRLFRTAYGVTPLLDRGIDGRGQTVVLLEAVQLPGAAAATDIRQDLALFDRLFALPAADLKVTTSLASGAPPYLANGEEAGDVEMVHAIAPDAAIQVILLPTVKGVNLPASASPHIGMAVALDFDGKQIVSVGDGTSAAAPFWAGIIALADQSAGRQLGYINPAIYRIGRSSGYHRAFHDVITGDNTVNYPSGNVDGYHAAPGWDPVTGWGSPNAQVLVPLLAAES